MRFKLNKKGVTRVIVFPDTQFPHIDKKALSAVNKYLLDKNTPKFDLWLQLGDLMDFGYCSRWTKGNYRFLEGKRFMKDYEAANAWLDDLQATLKKNNRSMKFVVLEGNHDKRPEDVIDMNPALEGLIEIEVGLDFEARNIQYIKNWNSKEPYIIGNANFIHGDKINSHHAKGMSHDWDVPIFYGHCFDEGTELLTKRGWLKYKEIKEDDICLTMNKDTEILEWNKVNRKFIYDAPKEMLQIKSKKIDLLVDNEHGLVTKTHKDGKWKYVKAKSLFDKKNWFFKTSGDSNNNKELDISDDVLRLAAWVISEGSIYKIGNTDYVDIVQSKPKDIKRIKQILDTLEYSYLFKEKAKSSISKLQPYRFRLHSKASKEIVSFIKDKKTVNDWFWRMSDRQFTIFADEYIMGDGSTYTGRYKNQRMIYTNIPEWVDAFQTRLFMTGYRTSVYWKKGSFKSNKLCAQINIFKQDQTTIKTDSHVKLVPYKGKMWCVNVDNGTLVVRRNGKITVTQNTHDINCHSRVTRSKEKVVVAQSLGCLCRFDMDYVGKKPTNWQQAVTVFNFLPNGNFQYDILRIINGVLITQDGRVFIGD